MRASKHINVAWEGTTIHSKESAKRQHGGVGGVVASSGSVPTSGPLGNAGWQGWRWRSGGSGGGLTLRGGDCRSWREDGTLKALAEFQNRTDKRSWWHGFQGAVIGEKIRVRIDVNGPILIRASIKPYALNLINCLISRNTYIISISCFFFCFFFFKAS